VTQVDPSIENFSDFADFKIKFNRTFSRIEVNTSGTQVGILRFDVKLASSTTH
jgi:hypothetical protein